MARCAVQSEMTGILSGSCASRILVWRGAQLNQAMKRNLWHLRVAQDV
ncbi:hypothetical protein A2U01_0098047, partial [Trifolium medium]|nr:hypothetical protein [Trifolium medium]